MCQRASAWAGRGVGMRSRLVHLCCVFSPQCTVAASDLTEPTLTGAQHHTPLAVRFCCMPALCFPG